MNESNLLNRIKSLKMAAMKENNTESRIKKEAYNAVISSVQTISTRPVDGKMVEVDNVFILGVIKREIRMFREAVSSDPNVLKEYELKAKVLEELLPKQLLKEDLEILFSEFTGEKNPKAFMMFLDEKGYGGSYNKSEAAAIALKK